MIVSWRCLNELLEKGGDPPFIQSSRKGIISNKGPKNPLLDGLIVKNQTQNSFQSGSFSEGFAVGFSASAVFGASNEAVFGEEEIALGSETIN